MFNNTDNDILDEQTVEDGYVDEKRIQKFENLTQTGGIIIEEKFPQNLFWLTAEKFFLLVENVLELQIHADIRKLIMEEKNSVQSWDRI